MNVKPDSSVYVQEDIKFYSLGREFKHGVVRWLPMKYIDYYVNSAWLDNQPTDYWIDFKSDHSLVYIGDADYYLTHGMHTIRFRYVARKAINFYNSNFDELYWNVTGNDWDFKIKHATARVKLPNQAIIKQSYGYTGLLGSKDQNY